MPSQQATRNVGLKRVALVTMLWAVVTMMWAGQKEFIAGHGRPTSSASPREGSSVRMMAEDPVDRQRYYSSNYSPSGQQSMAANSGSIVGVFASIAFIGALTVGMGLTKVEKPPASTIDPQGSFRVMKPAMDKLQSNAGRVIEDMIHPTARR